VLSVDQLSREPTRTRSSALDLGLPLLYGSESTTSHLLLEFVDPGSRRFGSQEAARPSTTDFTDHDGPILESKSRKHERPDFRLVEVQHLDAKCLKETGQKKTCSTVRCLRRNKVCRT
jgi:hypothetical protein